MTGSDKRQDDYRAIRAEVLAAFPSAREEERGLTFCAIKARDRSGSKVTDRLLGSGSNADRAWADAWEKNVAPEGEPDEDREPAVPIRSGI